MTLTAEQRELVGFLRTDATALKAHAETSGKLSAEGCLVISREIVKAAALITSMGEDSARMESDLGVALTDLGILSSQIEEAKGHIKGLLSYADAVKFTAGRGKNQAERIESARAFLKGGKQQ